MLNDILALLGRPGLSPLAHLKYLLRVSEQQQEQQQELDRLRARLDLLDFALDEIPA